MVGHIKRGALAVGTGHRDVNGLGPNAPVAYEVDAASGADSKEPGAERKFGVEAGQAAEGLAKGFKYYVGGVIGIGHYA